MIDTQKNYYRGKVEVAFKNNKSVIKKIVHNSGLSDMALLFAKAVTDSLDNDRDIPRLIDIGYIPKDKLDTGVWMSVLNKPVVIGGRQYNFDSSLNNWVATLIATLYYSDINGGIIDEVLQKVDSDEYVLLLRLCSYNPIKRKYFAEVPISADEIRKIKESTSAIITWYTELLYNYDSEINTGDVEGQI